MKSNELKEFFKTLMLFILALVILIIPSIFVTKHSTIEGEFVCTKIRETELKCSFSCNIVPKYVNQDKVNNLKCRAIVFHSTWTSIFDKTYDTQSMKKFEFEIEVPKRNYIYTAIVSMYDNNGNIGVSNKTGLQC